MLTPRANTSQRNEAWREQRSGVMLGKNLHNLCVHYSRINVKGSNKVVVSMFSRK
jgi:hypothetical protein